MAYNWIPSSSQATTTAPRLVAAPRPGASASGAATVATVIEEFIEAAEAGRARNRSGRHYRPSALRDVRGSLRHHVTRRLGDMSLRDVRRQDIQMLVDRLVADGLSESRIRSVISALRALYGWAIERGYVEFSPADGLVMARNDEQSPGDHPDAAWADDGAPLGEGPIWSWEDRPGDAREDRPTPRSRRRSRADHSADRKGSRPRADRDGSSYEPIAMLPERILSLALRAVFVLFVLIAILSLTQSA